MPTLLRRRKVDELEEIAVRLRLTKEAVSVLRSARSLFSYKERKATIDNNILKAQATLNSCSARVAKLLDKQR